MCRLFLLRLALLRLVLSKEASWSKERNRLLRLNQGLARKVAWRFAQRTKEPFSELFNVAMAGLVVAVDKFNPNSGNAFSSYAIPTIRGEILHYLRDDRKPGGVNFGRKEQPKVHINSLDRPVGWHDLEPESESISQKDALEDIEGTLRQARYEEWQDLYDALEALPEIRRRAIILHYFGGLKQIEVAKHIDRNAVSVSRNIKQGLRALAEVLQNNER